MSFMPSGLVIRVAMTDPAHLRGALDDAAEDVGVVALDIGLAGLRDERQRAEPLHGVADRFVFVGGVPPVAGGRSQPLGFIERGHRGVRAVEMPAVCVSRSLMLMPRRAGSGPGRRRLWS